MTAVSEEHEKLTFELGQEVTAGDVKKIVAPENTLDFVEEKRLSMIASHVNLILDPATPPNEVLVQQRYLVLCGGDVLLEHLPER